MSKKAIDWKAPHLVGKRFTFAGSAKRRDAADLVKAEGGEALPQVTADVDFLVVERYQGGRTTGAEKKAEALIRKGVAIQVLDIAGFCRLFLPSRETWALAKRVPHHVIWLPTRRPVLSRPAS